jgi:hypothetical protein
MHEMREKASDKQYQEILLSLKEEQNQVECRSSGMEYVGLGVCSWCANQGFELTLDEI